MGRISGGGLFPGGNLFGMPGASLFKRETAEANL